MSTGVHVLVVDDEESIRSFASEVLRDDGWEVDEAESAEQAITMLPQQEWAAVFCDVVLGGADGFSVLRRFKEESPRTQVVLMTGHGSAAGALDATALGAYDYLLKPFGVEQLRALSAALRELDAVRTERRLMDRQKRSAGQSDLDLVGRSEAFIEVMKQVGRLAATNLPVLLTGESGTGKEVVASALHRRSQRADRPFVAVNCGAIPAGLIESELFGHVKGSFTGADRDRPGLWEEANGGTIFLDEITETTLTSQVKLLRALQEGEIRRVGCNQTQHVDVRVLAASNCDVEQEVEAGRFRKDLFYRLSAVSIALPPLRDRREDILPLSTSFAEVYSLNPKVGFSAEAVGLLECYSWPGNVRELENAVVHAVAMCAGTIRAQDLPERVRNYERSNVNEADLQTEESSVIEEEWLSLAQTESCYVKRVLAHVDFNKAKAARLLDVDRKTLDRMIKRHRLSLGNATKFPPAA